jgi:hypothetical protein
MLTSLTKHAFHALLVSGWITLKTFIFIVLYSLPKLIAELPPLLSPLLFGFIPYWLSLTNFLNCSETLSITSYYFYSCFYSSLSRFRSSKSFSLHFFITYFFQQPLGSGEVQQTFESDFSISFIMLLQVLFSSFKICCVLVCRLSVNSFNL